MSSYFRGRPVAWDPDAQAVEQERQAWVYEHVSGMNEMVKEFCVDPDREYALHRDEWVRSGDMTALQLMLEYVRVGGVTDGAR